MGPSTYKMKKPAQFYVLYILSWALLALTACSFLGLLDLTTNAAEMEAQTIIMEREAKNPVPEEVVAEHLMIQLTGKLMVERDTMAV